jgi:hypothetical protein
MIDSYDFGRIVIDGKVYTSDVIIYPDKVYSNWWRKEGHRLQKEDLKEVFDYAPEILVVGTGAYGSMVVSEETKREIESRGIKLIVERTEKACEIYNSIKSRKAVAALHLTC